MKVLVTGGSGMVGSYLKEIEPNWIYLSSKDCNLLSYDETSDCINTHNPECVIHLAAKVGGIADNMKYPFDYYEDNVLMNTNLLRAVRKNGSVKTLIGILSTCAYQDVSPIYPITEEMIYEGMPHESNIGYGFSKRMLALEIDIARKNGFNYAYVIPSNLYGKYESGDFESKHFIGALIDKIIFAEKNGWSKITLFGDGTPRRQFTYAGDVAKLISLMIQTNTIENVNIATEESLAISEIADIALRVTNKEHFDIVYDTNMPNGQHIRDVSIEKLKKLFQNFKFTSYIDGIKQTYDYIKNSL
jgi:GDP-L-fucose synthase